jgi:hypothetical protein
MALAKNSWQRPARVRPARQALPQRAICLDLPLDLAAPYYSPSGSALDLQTRSDWLVLALPAHWLRC